MKLSTESAGSIVNTGDEEVDIGWEGGGITEGVC